MLVAGGEDFPNCAIRDLDDPATPNGVEALDTTSRSWKSESCGPSASGSNGMCEEDYEGFAMIHCEYEDAKGSCCGEKYSFVDGIDAGEP